MDKKKAVSLPAENEERMVVADIYIETDNFVKMYASRAAAQKKISRKPEDVEKVVKEIFDYIRYINALPEDTTIILDHQISEWPILNEFKDFIMPNTVRYEAGNRLFEDVLIRSNPFTGDIKKLSFHRYVDLLSEFRNFFKKDASDGKVMLDSLRVDKSFEDVRAVGACCWHTMHCHYNGDAFIPVPLKCLNVLVRNTYLNATDVEVVSDYLSHLFF